MIGSMVYFIDIDGAIIINYLEYHLHDTAEMLIAFVTNRNECIRLVVGPYPWLDGALLS